jgi:lipopolysaccharide transport system permease protein
MSSKAPSDSQWSTVIRSDSWVDLSFREIWGYRDLIVLLIRRDFTAQYKQTVLGPWWHVLNPLITTVAFTVVFGRIAGLSTEGRPALLFYLVGYVPWMYFARTLNTVSTTFVTNTALVTKVYFPRLVIPLAGVGSNLIALGIQSLLVSAFGAYYGLRGQGLTPTRWAFAIPLFVVLLGALGLGLGTMVAALTTKYRDLSHVVAFGTNLLMYATPVVYPAVALSPHHRWWLMLNPVSPLIEAFRRGLLGTGLITGGWLVYSTMATAVALAVGLLLFGRASRTFVDTI